MSLMFCHPDVLHAVIDAIGTVFLNAKPKTYFVDGHSMGGEMER